MLDKLRRWRQAWLAARLKRRVAEARQELVRCSICAGPHVKFDCPGYAPEHVYVGSRCVECGLDIAQIDSMVCVPSEPR